VIETNAPEPAPAQNRAAEARVTSATLFAGRTEIEIEHKGEIDRLRITRAGKLILTK